MQMLITYQVYFQLVVTQDFSYKILFIKSLWPNEHMVFMIELHEIYVAQSQQNKLR